MSWNKPTFSAPKVCSGEMPSPPCPSLRSSPAWAALSSILSRTWQEMCLMKFDSRLRWSSLYAVIFQIDVRLGRRQPQSGAWRDCILVRECYSNVKTSYSKCYTVWKRAFHVQRLCIFERNDADIWQSAHIHEASLIHPNKLSLTLMDTCREKEMLEFTSSASCGVSTWEFSIAASLAGRLSAAWQLPPPSFTVLSLSSFATSAYWPSPASLFSNPKTYIQNYASKLPQICRDMKTDSHSLHAEMN